MTFVIITHVPHILKQNQYFAYAPYVREMNIWIRQANKVIIVSPQSELEITDIEIHYEHQNIEFVKIDSFDMLNVQSMLKAVFKIPKIGWCIFNAMNKADHIHLRCPGNVGLLGSFVQILLPNKIKTAKYAGNWDPQSKQPWSYRLQKRILSNTFLTRKMQVLVYGDWPNQSRNITPFFTATYSEIEKLPVQSLYLNGNINFVFVGSLVDGKNPLYAIKLVECFLKNNHKVNLNIYGEGVLKVDLEKYIVANYLEKNVFLHGNQNADVIKKAFQNSHFVVLPSKSEGWPKAIAEGMFWGCVPIATSVSCVLFMLDNENRGILLSMDLIKDVLKIELLLRNQKEFDVKRINASVWSRKYTLDIFEKGIIDFFKV